MAKSKDKKWIENAVDEHLQSYDFVVESKKDSLINFTKEVCQKILEECQKKWEKIQSEVTSVYNDKDLMPHDIKNIINELGVQI